MTRNHLTLKGVILDHVPASMGVVKRHPPPTPAALLGNTVVVVDGIQQMPSLTQSPCPQPGGMTAQMSHGRRCAAR